MFRWMRAIWYKIAGWFGMKTEGLYEDAAVQAATYDKAIDTSRERFNTVKNAVAELMRLEQTRINEIKELQAREDKLAKIKSGAQVAMQRRINQLREEGKDKDQIQADPEFIKHSAAFKDASSTLTEVEGRIAEKESDLAERRKQVGIYETELQNMQRGVKKLQEEKAETIADTTIAKQSDAIQSVLAGIAQDTADQDLASVRSARDRVKARATLTGRLVGADANVAESQYLDLAGQSSADKELDSLLDWGDEEKTGEGMTDAKLPEN
jgi:myosin heavy subunit